MGALEQPFFLLMGVRESAFLVAEELALEQRFGERGAVNSQKRLVAPWAVVVDFARHQLLPRPALAQDQRRVCRGRHFQNHPNHGFGGGGFSDDGLFEPGQVLENFVHNAEQLVSVHGLFQVLVNPALGGLDGRLDGRVPRDEDDGDGGVGGQNFLQQLPAGMAGRLWIRLYDIPRSVVVVVSGS